MTIDRILSAGVALTVLLSCAALPAWADRGDRNGRGNERGEQGVDRRPDPPYRKGARPDDARHYKNRGYVRDIRHRHNHYYPPRGRVIKTLPRHHHVVPYRGHRYHFHHGVWYRPSGARFVVVLPPVGVVVPVLPPFYTTLWVHGVPYYYADGVYYTWRPYERTYVVTAPPPASAIVEPPEEPDELFIYPAKGQSEQQQATDRYQCHTWSKDQTSFDPTLPGGNVPEGQYDGKRTDYQRAMKACLEARGYSVQ
jgi:hypothetical protein